MLLNLLHLSAVWPNAQVTRETGFVLAGFGLCLLMHVEKKFLHESSSSSVLMFDDRSYVISHI